MIARISGRSEVPKVLDLTGRCEGDSLSGSDAGWIEKSGGFFCPSRENDDEAKVDIPRLFLIAVSGPPS